MMSFTCIVVFKCVKSLYVFVFIHYSILVKVRCGNWNFAIRKWTSWDFYVENFFFWPSNVLKSHIFEMFWHWSPKWYEKKNIFLLFLKGFFKLSKYIIRRTHLGKKKNISRIIKDISALSAWKRAKVYRTFRPSGLNLIA